MAFIGATGDSGDPTSLYDPLDESGFYQGKNGVYKDDQGRSYVMDPVTGAKQYIESYGMAGDAHNQSGLLTSAEFNPDTGKLDNHINWGNIIGLAAGAEPLIAGGIALAGGAGAGAGGGGGAASGGGSAATTAGAAAGGTGAGGDVLASSPLLMSNGAALPATVAPVAGSAGITGAGTGILSTVGKYANAAQGIGQAIGGATDQAAKNRIAQNDPYVSRAVLDDKERTQALKDLYVADRAQNPSNSPFDPRPVQAAGGAYGDALKAIQGQDLTRLQKPGQYNATTLPSLAPSTLEKVGGWAGPILSILGTIGKFL